MISGYGFSHRKFNFPCGDTHVQVELDEDNSGVVIDFEYENDGEIIELLLLCDAIRREGSEIIQLNMPYVPFSRQDRVVNSGEPFSIKVFANLINSLKIPSIVIHDPHSDVTPALIENVRIVPQEDIFRAILLNKYLGEGRDSVLDYVLVAPDGGSLKKIYKVAQGAPPLQVLECNKSRNTKTGEITGVHVPDVGIRPVDHVIVDDLCDGGQTFIKLAKKLKQMGAPRVILMVSHGFFTKGMKVFDGIIDEIYTRKGRVK